MKDVENRISLIGRWERCSCRRQQLTCIWLVTFLLRFVDYDGIYWILVFKLAAAVLRILNLSVIFGN